MAKLGEVADWGSGGTPRRGVAEYFGKGVPWLSIADLNDGLVTDAKESLTPAGIASSSAKIVPAGTLFVAMYGSIGKLGVAGREMSTSQAIAFAKPHTDRVDPRFLFHYLLAQRPALQARGRGGTQMNISQGDLKAWPFPLLPLPEQRRIAAILDHADAVRAKRRQVLAHLDTLTQSIFHDMFDRSPWPTIPVVELAETSDDVKCGPFGTQLQKSEFRTSGVPLLGIKNVNAKFGLPPFEFLDQATAHRLRAYSVLPGDIVMTRKGTIGNCAVYPLGSPPAVMHSDLLRLRISPSKADSTYLEHHLQFGRRVSRQIARMSPGAVMPGINVTKLKQLEVEVPPIALQHQFAERVALIGEQRWRAHRDLAAYDELFAALQVRAFRGEL